MPHLNWEPAVYEHKAALLGRPVREVANCPRLLAEALMAEYEAYRPDALVVGMDLYNLEAEACGVPLRDLGPQACPDADQPIWNIDALPKELPPLPSLACAGRFGLMLDAATRVRRRLPAEVGVRVAASGPMSIAAKLVGLEPLVTALALSDSSAERLLQFTTELAVRWITAIRAAGFDAIVFDSSAAPPMLSPALYGERIQPLHTRLMNAMTGQVCRPLILGGDTSCIAAFLAATGATYLVCDYPAEVANFAAQCPSGSTVRRNVDPRGLCDPRQDVADLAGALRRDLDVLAAHGHRPVAGTGVLPYDANPARIRALRDALRVGE